MLLFLRIGPPQQYLFTQYPRSPPGQGKKYSKTQTRHLDKTLDPSWVEDRVRYTWHPSTTSRAFNKITILCF